MNEFDDACESVQISDIGKKKRRCPEESKRAKAKKNLHSGSEKVPKINCKHDHPKFCGAKRLTEEDLVNCHNHLYATDDKVTQDGTLLTFMEINKSKRIRIKGARKQSRDVSVKYFVLTKDKERVSVCKATFITIFGVSKDRISRISKYWMDNGTPKPETRGGSRISNEMIQKKDSIKDHIKLFTCRASHYGRAGAPCRKYLPSDLNVKKMHQLFIEQNHVQVTYSLYYHIFTHDFNLAFGHPATDICSTCAKYRIKMKDPDMTDQEKKTEAALFILHRRRARKFYDLMNTVNGTITVCFDLMENLVLPKTPIGQAFYSRQLYMYVFGVVNHHGSNNVQTKDDVNLYVWLEHQSDKGSDMVASALMHCFKNVMSDSLNQQQHLRLFSDSCFGQNKNINVLSMLFALRKQKYPHLKITHFFPVRGHSFLPADRVFGRIGKELNKKETILLPEEYISILRKHGKVFVFGTDWCCFDFKSEVSKATVFKRNFKISEAKALEINGDHVGFQTVYSGQCCYHSILKRGKSWDRFHPHEKTTTSSVKASKKADVLKLISDLGVNQDVREFYTTALSQVTTSDDSE